MRWLTKTKPPGGVWFRPTIQEVEFSDPCPYWFCY